MSIFIAINLVTLQQLRTRIWHDSDLYDRKTDSTLIFALLLTTLSLSETETSCISVLTPTLKSSSPILCNLRLPSSPQQRPQ
jgi:hypothetical protein